MLHTPFEACLTSVARRGIPMALFSIAAIGGTGLGPVASGWIEMNPHLGWRWIQWIQMMYAAAQVDAFVLAC